ncbi:MAG TPA: hypothetical protein VK507_08435, partial [Iamia sp.]|nr:hypothetical protein [Iamia sp.]
MRKTTRALVAVAVLVAAPLAACGADEPAADAADTTVKALDNVFGETAPHTIEVAVGETVT